MAMLILPMLIALAGLIVVRSVACSLSHTK
jgi:hypothetical protein